MIYKGTFYIIVTTLSATSGDKIATKRGETTYLKKVGVEVRQSVMSKYIV